MLRTLKAKLFLAMVILGIGPFLLGGILSYQLTLKSTVRQVEETLAGVSGPLARHIDSMLSEWWNDVQVISHQPIFRESDDKKKMSQVMEQLSRIYKSYALMAVVNAQGEIVSATKTDLVGLNVGKAGWFRKAKSITLDQWHVPRESVWNSEGYLSPLSDGIPVICFNTPIYDYQDRFTGAIHNEIRLAYLAQTVQNVRVGRTGYALLVRRDGVILASKDGLASSLDRKVGFPGAFGKSLLLGAGVTRETDSNGEEFFIGYARLTGYDNFPGMGWSVLVVQKTEEVFAPTAALLKVQLAIALVGVTLILVGGYFLLNIAISKPMSRLVAQARAIGQGDAAGETAITSKDEIGELSEALSQMVRDLKAHRSMERDLEQQLFQTEKFAAIGEMVAGVAHEVKNPLAAIKLTVQALNQEEDEQVKQEYFSRITNEINRLDAFLKTFFSFARPQEPSPRPYDLRKIIKETLTLLDKEISGRGITVKEEYPPDLPMVEVDYQQLQQVFLNLFLNAAQAMPTGGLISIKGEVDHCQAGKEETVQRVNVIVSDTGPGIPEEIREKVFDPFITTKPNGTGLGLAIVFRILEKHSGAIKMSSRSGQGSTFTVTLPLKQI